MDLRPRAEVFGESGEPGIGAVFLDELVEAHGFGGAVHGALVVFFDVGDGGEEVPPEDGDDDVAILRSWLRLRVIYRGFGELTMNPIRCEVYHRTAYRHSQRNVSYGSSQR